MARKGGEFNFAKRAKELKKKKKREEKLERKRSRAAANGGDDAENPDAPAPAIESGPPIIDAESIERD